jgi:hypothetical protein
MVSIDVTCSGYYSSVHVKNGFIDVAFNQCQLSELKNAKIFCISGYIKACSTEARHFSVRMQDTLQIARQEPSVDGIVPSELTE